MRTYRAWTHSNASTRVLGSSIEVAPHRAARAPAPNRLRVAADLETFVCSGRFSPTLAETDARTFVQARVEQHRAHHRELEERESKIARQRAITGRLVAAGRTYAFWETLSWDSADSAEAREAVAEELSRVVRWEWNEARVNRLVDRMLNEFLDDSEENRDGEDAVDEVD